tara:strand:+ start:1249 stop:1434 length:186 start_codon:yes stop_codon:yes gene_type:complete
MNNSNDIFNEMISLWNEFHENHTKFSDKGTKAAGARARKAIGSIKKLVTEYRKASVSESKQ